ncbi:hypothetical protein FM113_09305 [Leucobacter sp. 7(1)]|nr:hypothetical protein FM113_09305 [Leucobacter sp. 7(1)]
MDLDPTLGDLGETRDHAERGGLAGAAGAEERHKLTATNVDADIVNDWFATVSFGDIGESDPDAAGLIWLFLRRTVC